MKIPIGCTVFPPAITAQTSDIIVMFPKAWFQELTHYMNHDSYHSQLIFLPPLFQVNFFYFSLFYFNPKTDKLLL